MSIYVEAQIRGDPEELRRRIRTSQSRRRWDLRFTSITGRPRRDSSDPQRFRYAGRFGLGPAIEWWGEAADERTDAVARRATFRFGSESPRAFVRSGSGYLRLEPTTGGRLHLITCFGYEAGWGLLGRVVDRLLFRPALGWATAWSFDRLRLWIEKGVEPRQAARQALIHAVAAAAVAFCWIWQGVAPKLAGPHAEELALTAASGVPESLAPAATLLLGAVELAFGLAFPFFARRRWPWLLHGAAMAVASLAVVAAAPHLIVSPFSPLLLNLLMVALGAVGLLSLPDLPSARRCLRSPAGGKKRGNGR